MQINPSEIVRPALEAARPMTDTLSDAWQLVVGDRVAAWRLANAARIQAKVRDELRRLGLTFDAARIPERYAFAWFEEATKQSEPEIQELFARLLAKAAAGSDESGDRRLLEIVSRMTPSDAAALRFFFDDNPEMRPRVPDSGLVNEYEVEEYVIWSAIRKSQGDAAWRSVEHLLALGVLERRFMIDSDSVHSALSCLQTDASGRVKPSWGNSSDLEIRTFIASTATGLALHLALSSEAG